MGAEPGGRPETGGVHNENLGVLQVTGADGQGPKRDPDVELQQDEFGEMRKERCCSLDQVLDVVVLNPVRDGRRGVNSRASEIIHRADLALARGRDLCDGKARRERKREVKIGVMKQPRGRDAP